MMLRWSDDWLTLKARIEALDPAKDGELLVTLATSHRLCNVRGVAVRRLDRDAHASVLAQVAEIDEHIDNRLAALRRLDARAHEALFARVYRVDSHASMRREALSMAQDAGLNVDGWADAEAPTSGRGQRAEESSRRPALRWRKAPPDGTSFAYWDAEGGWFIETKPRFRPAIPYELHTPWNGWPIQCRTLADAKAIAALPREEIIDLHRAALEAFAAVTAGWKGHVRDTPQWRNAVVAWMQQNAFEEDLERMCKSVAHGGRAAVSAWVAEVAQRDPRAGMRLAAVRKMVYREHADIVERIAAEDPDADVRREAKRQIPWDAARAEALRRSTGPGI